MSRHPALVILLSTRAALVAAREVLGVTLDYAGGLTTDKNDKLIVCDMNKPAVDVIAPPYTHVTRTLGSGVQRSS